MDAYLDTGALVPLFTNEVFSEAITAYTEQRDQTMAISAFHRLEMENALQLKRFRGEVSDDQCLAALRKVASYTASGMLVLRPVIWIAALDKARELTVRVSASIGCRTLDLIHIAIALQWGCLEFVSADGRQLQAAKLAGLATVDLRTLAADAGPGETGRVRERRGAYRTRKRPARVHVVTS